MYHSTPHSHKTLLHGTIIKSVSVFPPASTLQSGPPCSIKDVGQYSPAAQSKLIGQNVTWLRKGLGLSIGKAGGRLIMSSDL